MNILWFDVIGKFATMNHFQELFLRLAVEPGPAFVAFDKHDFVLVSTANETMNKVCVQCNAVMQSLSRHLFEFTDQI